MLGQRQQELGVGMVSLPSVLGELGVVLDEGRQAQLMQVVVQQQALGSLAASTSGTHRGGCRRGDVSHGSPRLSRQCGSSVTARSG